MGARQVEFCAGLVAYVLEEVADVVARKALMPHPDVGMIVPRKSRLVFHPCNDKRQGLDLWRCRVKLEHHVDIGRHGLLPEAGDVVRCILPAMQADQARRLLGHAMAVTGRYEADREGRPRLMYVERAEPRRAPRHCSSHFRFCLAK